MSSNYQLVWFLTNCLGKCTTDCHIIYFTGCKVEYRKSSLIFGVHQGKRCLLLLIFSVSKFQLLEVIVDLECGAPRRELPKEVIPLLQTTQQTIPLRNNKLRFVYESVNGKRKLVIKKNNCNQRWVSLF